MTRIALTMLVTGFVTGTLVTAFVTVFLPSSGELTFGISVGMAFVLSGPFVKRIVTGGLA